MTAIRPSNSHVAVLAALFDAERVKPLQGEFDKGVRAGLSMAVEKLKQEPSTQQENDLIVDFLDRLKVVNGYLVEYVGRHTCGTGPDGHYGAHEPFCGYEMICNLSEITLSPL